MDFMKGISEIPNIHPIVVHFPIALLLTSGALLVLGILTKKEFFVDCGACNLVIGAFSAIFAVLTGLLAASSVSHPEGAHATMVWHRNIMISVLAVSLALAFWVYKNREQIFLLRVKLITGLMVMLSLLIVGADMGGQMVFKHGVGTALLQDMEGSYSHEHGEQATGHDH